jgi:L-2-hydroxyglutarate oxidase
MFDVAVVGGGIVGLATVRVLNERYPDWKILVLEKEASWGYHQTGHNSGVIHSGIYYPPGSLKASLTVSGNSNMVSFCDEHDIAYEICGKLIVATDVSELPALETLYTRGRANNIAVERVEASRISEFEPHVRGLAALHVASTGIVSYKMVCQALARDAAESGAEMRLNCEVLGVDEADQSVTLASSCGDFSARYLINCAGLHSDRIVEMVNQSREVRIVPFRGEYYELRPESRHLVKNLIYPVPNPAFPFLGVHFTRMVGGGVEAGPNAVLGLSREGYKKTDANMRDFIDVMQYRGFWKLASKYWKYGAGEMARSFLKPSFVRSLQRLIPAISGADLVPAPAGVRAQALRPDGTLVDDFYFITGRRALHVCNAPSPAATASLEIGKMIVDKLAAQFRLE